MRARYLVLILVLAAALAVAYCGSREGDAPLEWAVASVPNASEVQAPVIGMSVGSAEGDYFLDVDAAIPYCQNFDRIVGRRSGSEVEVVVINRVVGHGVVFLCAEGYRSTEYLTVNLGSDFEPGAVNTVLINDQSLTFIPTEPSASNESAIGPSFRSNRVGKAPQPIPGQFPPLMASEGQLPFELIGVRVTDSSPASYVLDLRGWGFNGCNAFRRIDVRQSGERIEVRAVDSLNWWPAVEFVCDILFAEDISVDLGSDFEPGVTYTVSYSEGRVLTEFTAE